MPDCSPSVPCWNAPTCILQTNSRCQLFKSGERRRRRSQFLSTTITIMSLCYRGALPQGVDPSPCPFQVTYPLHSTACVFSCMSSLSHLTAVLAHAQQLQAPHSPLSTFSVLEDMSEGIRGESLLVTLIFMFYFFLCCVCLTIRLLDTKTLVFRQLQKAVGEKQLLTLLCS